VTEHLRPRLSTRYWTWKKQTPRSPMTETDWQDGPATYVIRAARADNNRTGDLTTQEPRVTKTWPEA
jgi:hypothetical protein